MAAHRLCTMRHFKQDHDSYPLTPQAGNLILGKCPQRSSRLVSQLMWELIYFGDTSAIPLTSYGITLADSKNKSASDSKGSSRAKKSPRSDAPRAFDQGEHESVPVVSGDYPLLSCGAASTDSDQIGCQQQRTFRPMGQPLVKMSSI